MKKYHPMIIRMLSLCMVLITFLSITPVIYAVETTDNLTTVFFVEDTVTPLAEETGWIFRNYNGILQMRLWSYTEGKWLTDWIDVGTAA